MLGVILSGVMLQYGLNRNLPLIEAYQQVYWFMAVIVIFGIVAVWKLKR